VQRVPVRIELDEDDDKLAQYPLRLGLSMDVTVDIHDTDGPKLTQQSPAVPHYQTGVYNDRAAGAKQLIERIMQANLHDNADDDDNATASADDDA